MLTRILLLILLPLYGSSQIITTVAGNGQGGGVRTYTGGVIGAFGGDGGPATAAALDNPMHIAFDSHGNMFVSDLHNNLIRKVDTNGIISTYAGNADSAGRIQGKGYYSGDGGQATNAQLNYPWGITFDADDNLYIADVGNYVIRKVTPSGIISTYAGVYRTDTTVKWWNSGEGGPATNADFSDIISGLAMDKKGNLYFVTNSSFIAKVDHAGILTVVAGAGWGEYMGEGGPATDAHLGECQDVAVDEKGNIYFVDNYNNRVLKVNTSGIISTLAGNGTHGNEGDGGPASSAQFNYLTAITVDRQGNIYVNDLPRVRKISTSGIITTVAGTISEGYGGDGGPATAAQLNCRGLAFDKVGNLFIADQNNNRVRGVGYVGNIKYNSDVNAIASKVLNPNKGTFTLEGSFNSAGEENIFIRIVDRDGNQVYEKEVLVQNGVIKTQIALDNSIADGIYVLHIKSANQEGKSRILIQK